MSLIEVIKQASIEAVRANKPVEVVFGNVLSVSPLKVKLDQKLILNEAQLILGAYTADSFVVGNKLVLLRVQGGKQYLVLPTITAGGSEFDMEYDEPNEEIILGG